MYQLAISKDKWKTYTMLPTVYREFNDAHAAAKNEDIENIAVLQVCERYWVYSLLDTSRPLQYEVR